MFAGTLVQQSLPGVAPPAPPQEPEITKEEIQQALSTLLRARYCMSYEDSYCGEPIGTVKRFVADCERAGAKPI